MVRKLQKRHSAYFCDYAYDEVPVCGWVLCLKKNISEFGKNIQKTMRDE